MIYRYDHNYHCNYIFSPARNKKFKLKVEKPNEYSQRSLALQANPADHIYCNNGFIPRAGAAYNTDLKLS